MCFLGIYMVQDLDKLSSYAVPWGLMFKVQVAVWILCVSVVSWKGVTTLSYITLGVMLIFELCVIEYWRSRVYQKQEAEELVRRVN